MCSLCIDFFSFETEYHCGAQTGLELAIFLPQPPKYQVTWILSIKKDTIEEDTIILHFTDENPLAYKGDRRISKTPKKLASICCPQHRETKADTLKATEANRKRGPGTREKVRSKRINLEGNTHTQEVNVSQLPV
jgi:hypothetical protein